MQRCFKIARLVPLSRPRSTRTVSITKTTTKVFHLPRPLNTVYHLTEVQY